MKFMHGPARDATGAILAHGVTAGGISMKKGRVLAPADIDSLAAAGVETVVTARLEPGDMHEDAAARAIADAIAGTATTTSVAHTGRCNIYAASAGLALIDRDRINDLNALHESITVATLDPFEPVQPRQMIATVKIIPFAAPEAAVARAIALAAGGPLVDAKPFRTQQIALVSTTLPGQKPAMLDRNRDVIAARAAALGSTIVSETRCSHEADAITQALSGAAATSAGIILVFGAAATTDRADEVPAGLVAAGGTIIHFGMPVDPGNLLLLGRLGHRHVIGLPGCARSPRLNGFDFVLQRLCAGIEVAPRDIQAMGVGGLLKEIPTRPQPRNQASVAPRAQRAPHVTAIVLAAGRSTRMGGTNKLLLDLHGSPLIARTLDALAASTVSDTMVVTGHDRAAIEAAIAGRNLRLVHNEAYAQGMSGSLRAGLAALTADTDAILVCLADMPAVTPQAINRIIAAFNPVESRAIIVPVFGGKRGNPVLFASGFRDEMQDAEGDAGARHVLSAHPETIHEVEMDDAGVLADADTPDAFAALEAGLKP